MHTKKQPQDGEASNHVLIFSNRSLEPALMAGVPGPLLGEDWICSWDFFFCETIELHMMQALRIYIVKWAELSCSEGT